MESRERESKWKKERRDGREEVEEGKGRRRRREGEGKEKQSKRRNYLKERKKRKAAVKDIENNSKRVKQEITKVRERERIEKTDIARQPD